MLNTYEEIDDLDYHLYYFELMLQYRGAMDTIKCKISPLTLTKETLIWFRSLRLKLVSSWLQLSKLFSARFTASRLKPKSENVLKEIRQGEAETMRKYMEQFNMEAVNVRNLSNKMRLYFMKEVLRRGSLFHIDISINRPTDLGDFLRRSQKYIDYEEDDLASQAKSALVRDLQQKDV